jgi:hypothetical protein
MLPGNLYYTVEVYKLLRISAPGAAIPKKRLCVVGLGSTGRQNDEALRLGLRSDERRSSAVLR